MEGKKLKGIALILFGILLHMSGSEINNFLDTSYILFHFQ